MDSTLRRSGGVPEERAIIGVQFACWHALTDQSGCLAQKCNVYFSDFTHRLTPMTVEEFSEHSRSKLVTPVDVADVMLILEER